MTALSGSSHIYLQKEAAAFTIILQFHPAPRSEGIPEERHRISKSNIYTYTSVPHAPYCLLHCARHTGSSTCPTSMTRQEVAGLGHWSPASTREQWPPQHSASGGKRGPRPRVPAYGPRVGATQSRPEDSKGQNKQKKTESCSLSFFLRTRPTLLSHPSRHKSLSFLEVLRALLLLL